MELESCVSLGIGLGMDMGRFGTENPLDHGRADGAGEEFQIILAESGRFYSDTGCGDDYCRDHYLHRLDGACHGVGGDDISDAPGCAGGGKSSVITE